VTGEAEPRPSLDAVTEPAVVIVSGLSGGGKTAAAKLFEDLGYTVAR
jgi:adenylylsulfate kinase-like enzyme